ncbi:MAG TPA: hypothetical protein VMH00_05150 [Candidatus Limnocylindrales bacterium]|nr:hypothetical protein [Candidatus Limnocylindrales bacterium]
MPGDAILTHEIFSKCAKQKCKVHHPSGTLEVELVECRKLTLPGRAGANREPFALLFLGPTTPVLPQRIYPIEFTGLGTMDIFIVPIGPDSGGMQYEAIFT